MRRLETASLVVAALLVGSLAHAQNTDPAAAQALFDDAKQLVEAGKFGEACPKFLASFRLDPKPGAMMNLADCYEKNGQLASAWARFLEGAALAQRAGQAERQQFGRDRAKALEPKLSRLIIAAPTSIQGLEVLRDGVAVDLAMLGTGVPLDAGKHEITARAPGKRPWTTTVQLAVGAAPLRVDIPPLQDDPTGRQGPVVPPVVTPPPVTGAGPVETPAGAPAPFWGPQRVAGVVTGAVGVIGVIIGGAFGASAASKWSTAKNGPCSGTPTTCTAQGEQDISDAKSAATISSATLIPGAILVAAGVVIFVTAPKQTAPTTTGLVLAPVASARGAAFTLKGSL